MKELISRIEAKEKGLTRYFTGLECRHGHLSERMVTTRGCVECLRQRENKYPKHYRRDLLRKRKETVVNLFCKNCGNEIPKDVYCNTKYCTPRCRYLDYGRPWVDSHPENIKSSRARANANTPNRIHSRIKSRAKIAGLDFDLEKSDIIVPEICPVLGIKIDPMPRPFIKNRPDSPSVDRIDPTKGYVKGNVRIISNRANLLKSNAEIWELEAVLKDLKRIREEC